MSDNDIGMFNLKLTKTERQDFKTIAKRVHDKTMQQVLSAFVKSYISNPEQFTIETTLGVINNVGPRQTADEVV